MLFQKEKKEIWKFEGFTPVKTNSGINQTMDEFIFHYKDSLTQQNLEWYVGAEILPNGNKSFISKPLKEAAVMGMENEVLKAVSADAMKQYQEMLKKREIPMILKEMEELEI